MGCNQSRTDAPAVRRVVIGRERDGSQQQNSPSQSGSGVRVPAPWKADGPVTAAKLEGDRAMFWDTNARMQGNPRVWEALHVAAEALLHADAELANTILDASEIRAPHGTLAMCYDARGYLYEIPQYVFSNPTNIVTAEEISTPKRTGHIGSAQDIPVTVRLSSSAKTTEQDIDLTVSSNERIAAVKQRLHTDLAAGVYDGRVFGADTVTSVRRGEGNKWTGVGLPPSHQRWYCQGRYLPDDCLVQECGVKPHLILQVFIKPPMSR